MYCWRGLRPREILTAARRVRQLFGKTVTGSATSEPPRPLRVVGDPKAPTTPKPRPDERSFAR